MKLTQLETQFMGKVQSMTLLWILCYAPRQGVLHTCPMRGFTQQPTEMDGESHSETWDVPSRRLTKSWGRIACPEDGRNSTGSTEDSMNI